MFEAWDRAADEAARRLLGDQAFRPDERVAFVICNRDGTVPPLHGPDDQDWKAGWNYFTVEDGVGLLAAFDASYSHRRLAPLIRAALYADDPARPPALLHPATWALAKLADLGADPRGPSASFPWTGPALHKRSRSMWAAEAERLRQRHPGLRLFDAYERERAGRGA
ncbi:MAG TPA: hypothetical protein VNI01_04470 [Elusimicrobiota bacterium]|jgi:hypothetical protein|nr:hypothetical protein [Elusimicrobiota bacterium]